MRLLFLVSIFIISTCGLIYELISGTLASYLLGDSVTQFSTVIGVYLFSMGVGSYLSGFVEKNILRVFIQVELLIGLLGGSSAAILFILFEFVSSFRVLLYSIISVIGILVGLEIPLMMRILKSEFEFKDLVSKIFTFDYVGSLIAAVLFPLVLVPHFGLIRSSFFFGILNCLVALGTLLLFGRKMVWARLLQSFAWAILGILLGGLIFSDEILTLSESLTYPGRVVFTRSTPYQRIILTQKADDLRLFLNNNLQFSSKDEYRYHEALVHVGMQSLNEKKSILVLGGGDGLAVRELLKYHEVEKICLVDLDPEITRLFSTHPDLLILNERSLLNSKVKIVNEDAFQWLKNQKELFDFVVVDFPDPSNFSVAKLFSTTFYRELFLKIKHTGAAVIQATSPYVARKAYWCIDKTLRFVGFNTTPYHTYIPAFGEWGFILASQNKISIAQSYLPHLKYVSKEIVQAMLFSPSDMSLVPTGINRLNHPLLVQYFDEEWANHAP